MLKMRAPKLQRCRSMPDIEDEDENSKKGNRQKKGKTSNLKKGYMGRRSLGVAGVSAKVKRKKSKNEWDRDIHDDASVFGEEEYLEPSTPSRTFQCIPSLEKSTNLSNTFLLSPEVETRSIVPVEKRFRTASLLEPMQLLGLAEQLETIESNRACLHQEIDQLIKQVNRPQSEQGVSIRQRKIFCMLFGETWRFLVGGDDNKKYTLGNVLWIVLKSYFTAKKDGRELVTRKEDWLQEDKRIAKMRTKYIVILDEIRDFQFQTQLACIDREEGSLNREIEFSEKYCAELREAKKEVSRLLEGFDKLVELYPYYKEFWERVEEERGFNEKIKIENNVTAMRVWLNTLEDMDDKLKALGTLFDVNSTKNGNLCWLRPLDEDNQISMVKELSCVFKNCVQKSLDLKGMSKVLERVERIIGKSIDKTLFLLQKAPGTYAEAATTSKTTNIDPAFEEMIGWRFSSGVYKNLQFPSLTRICLFLIAVPIHLVVYWLQIRSETDPPESSDLDELTLSAMITDSRDCVEEAVKIKSIYDERMGTICSKCAHSEYFYPFEYNTYVLDVFKKYVYYVNRWANCVTVRSQPKQLFLRLEKEWNLALSCARRMKSGVESLCSIFCGISESLLQDMIESYAAEEIDRIKSEYIEDMNFEEDFEKDYSMFDDQQFQKFTISVNAMLKELKERSMRIFSLLRGALNDIHDAVGYQISSLAEMDPFVEQLKEDFCMVQLVMTTEEKINLQMILLVDKISADKATCENCLLAIAEGKKVENGCVLTIPDKNHSLKSKWNGRLVKITIDEETRFCYTHLRTDLIMLISDEKSRKENDKKWKKHLKMVAPSCSSNVIISDRFQDLTKNVLLEHLDNEKSRVDVLLDRMESGIVQETEKAKASLEFKLERNFLTAIQVHRDVARIISDSFIQDLGTEMIDRAIKLMQQWKSYLEIKPTRPTHNLPMWAQPAFSILQLFTENKWTAIGVMNDEQYDQIVQLFKHFKEKLILPAAEKWSAVRKPPMFRQKMSRSTSSKHSSTSNIDQMEKLRLLEVERDRKLIDSKIIGEVVADDRQSTKEIRQTKAPFKWVLLHKIASGSFGTVYHAMNLDARRMIAAKLMTIQPKTAPFIEAEIDIFRKLNHENLVKYYGIEVKGDEVYILMELCSQGTLEQYGKMDLNRARMFTNSLLRAVQYLHAKKIIHSDIKPPNIFIDANNGLKLGDFGCSSQLTTSSTMFGEFQKTVGTANYMAPEVFSLGEKNDKDMYSGYGRSIDIWSVGCTVVEMLTGEKPFQGLTLHQIAFKICLQFKTPDYPQIAEQRGDLKEFLGFCFEFDPKNRKSASELLQTTFAHVMIKEEM